MIFDTYFVAFTVKVFLTIFPLIGVFLLGFIAWKMWVHYIQQDFISGIEWTMLEIVPPRNVERSPKAMELFFTNALYHWSMKGGLEQYWQGAVWFWFSLEIASIEGQVHFYIRTPSRLKDLIETQIYAQYPQAQVKVVEDYTMAVDKITPTSKYNLWGCEFKLAKPDAYPIKTYVDFGLDKDPKEEYKIDPISPLIELFGSVQRGEQMWVQIVVRPSKKEFHEPGTMFKKHDWVEESRQLIKRLAYPYTKSEKVPGREEPLLSGRTPDFMKNTLEGIEKKASKIGFDVGIRACYVAKREIFPMGSRTNGSRNIRLIFRQYSNTYLNYLERTNSTQADAYGGFFLASPKTVTLLAGRMLHEYQERGFFHLPMRHYILSTHTLFWPFTAIFKAYKHPPVFVLNIEELATLWHFPGQILKVPTLERIESKEAAPPTNLPI